MNIKKKVTVAGTIFVLLAGATILSGLLAVGSKKIATGRFFVDFDTSAVTKVIIGDSSTGVVLTKTVSGWVVADRSGSKSYRADQVKALAMVDKIGLMQKDQLVSENKSNHQSLAVTAEKGVTVSVYSSGSSPDHTFYLGKKSENWRYTNVRLEKENAVYLVEGSIQFAFVTGLSEWRDRSIFSHPADSIIRVVLADGSILEKSQGVGESFWVARFSGQEIRANQDNVASYLSSMSKFVCSDWADETLPEESWKNPTGSYSVIFTMADGTVETITLGTIDPSGRNRYYFKNSVKEDLYFVVGSDAEVPFASFQFMVAPPTPTPTAAGTVAPTGAPK